MATLHRMSNSYAPTLKEVPSEAEIASHRLLLRAGMIRKVASGIYTYLPLALRSLRKIEQIVREEMDAIGSQELLLPVVQPAELWRQSGRWDVYGPELTRLSDRHGREFCLGPTHEEVITNLVRDEVRSYRDLPLSLFQINLKFRDEIRPRFGLLRGREFIMKDAYSFHADEADLVRHYDDQAGAYGRICERVGLDYRPVVADSGQIGGSVTTEFMALAEAGEADLVYCACGYAANTEAGESNFERPAVSSVPLTVERVHTPGASTIASLAEMLGVVESQTVKAMVAKTEAGRVVMFFIPGDRELNLIKAERITGPLTLLEEDDFAKVGLVKGFIGPLDRPEGALVLADESLREDAAWLVGANEVDYHLANVAPGRDFDVDHYADLTVVRAGDRCPSCGASLAPARGIEVSQVFQLGTKYSVAMGASFVDEAGEERPLHMGCYGVGVSRTLAAAIEQHHDDAGIIWPVSIAPYEVIVIALDVEGEVFAEAQRIARELSDGGFDVMLDDREMRPGIKFAEADLIGFPVHVVVGARGLAEGKAEVKVRSTGVRDTLPVGDIVSTATERINELKR